MRGGIGYDYSQREWVSMTRTNSEVAGNAEALVESTRQTIEVSKRLCHQSVELCCDLNAILTRLQESRAIHQNAIATAKQGSC